MHYHRRGYTTLTFLDHPFYHTPAGHRLLQWLIAIFMPPICLLCFYLAFTSGSLMVWVLSIVCALASIGNHQYHKDQADAGPWPRPDRPQ